MATRSISATWYITFAALAVALASVAQGGPPPRDVLTAESMRDSSSSKEDFWTPLSSFNSPSQQPHDGKADTQPQQTTLDPSICSTTTCRLLGQSLACDKLASVLDENLNYVHHSTWSCRGIGQLQRCCAQTCKADTECPEQHFCQSFNSGQKYCYKCTDCQ